MIWPPNASLTSKDIIFGRKRPDLLHKNQNHHSLPHLPHKNEIHYHLPHLLHKNDLGTKCQIYFKRYHILPKNIKFTS